MLTLVFPVVLGRPEPWMFSWVKKQPLPGLALICQLSLAKTSVICCMLRRFSIAYLISSRDFLMPMICMDRLRSSSAVTSTNGNHMLREAMP